jgi:hypothetical protein
VGGWTVEEGCCRLYRISETAWGTSSAMGALASAAATLPEVAHGATWEHSEGGQR